MRKAAPLAPERAARLEVYQTLASCDTQAALAAQRFVVVDVESTGLDVFSDRLIAIGAVEVAGGRLHLGQGFEVVLRQAAPSTVDNILVHGIGGTEQTTGIDPVEALLAFLGYLGNAPLVAYHADFDRTLIERATREFLGITLDNPWIDLAQIAPALYPEHAPNRHALDDWTALFGIENPNRHNAVADACATAQLLLVLLARAQAQGHARVEALLQLEKDQRWLIRK